MTVQPNQPVSEQALHPVIYLFYRRECLGLQFRIERDRCALATDPANGCIQIIECVAVDDLAADFRAYAQELDRFVNDQDTVRFLRGFEYGIYIQRNDSPQIYDLCADAFLRQLIGCFQTEVHHPAVGHDRAVGSFSLDIGLSEGGSHSLPPALRPSYDRVFSVRGT